VTAPIVVSVAAVLLFAVYAILQGQASASPDHHRRWFVPAMLAWLGLGPVVTTALEAAAQGRASSTDYTVGSLWAAVFVAAAWWRYRARRRGTRLPLLGAWTRPTRAELACWVGSAAVVTITDVSSKVLIAGRYPPRYASESGWVCSSFHQDPFTYFHDLLLVGILLAAGVAGLFFRFRYTFLSFGWRLGAGAWIAASVVMTGERAIYGGVHDVFFIRGAAAWACPPCAIQYGAHYVFCIADMFVFWPQVLALLSCLVLYAIGRAQLVAERRRTSPGGRGPRSDETGSPPAV